MNEMKRDTRLSSQYYTTLYDGDEMDVDLVQNAMLQYQNEMGESTLK